MYQRVTKASTVSWSMKVVQLDYASHLTQDGQNEDPDAKNRDPILILTSLINIFEKTLFSVIGVLPLVLN